MQCIFGEESLESLTSGANHACFAWMLQYATTGYTVSMRYNDLDWSSATRHMQNHGTSQTRLVCWHIRQRVQP